jgi:hypothetical protein
MTVRGSVDAQESRSASPQRVALRDLRQVRAAGGESAFATACRINNGPSPRTREEEAVR